MAQKEKPLPDSGSTLEALVDLAMEVGLTLRRAPAATGDTQHPGGAVVELRGRQIVFLNPAAPTRDQIDVLVSVLSRCETLQGRFVRPDLRELLDSAGQD